MIDQEALQLLLKAPKKKYIKKLVEYAIAVSYNPKSCPPHLLTPIANQYPTDLELHAEQSHRLISSLLGLLSLAFRVDFSADELGKAFSSQFDGQLKDILIEIVVNLADEIHEYESRSIRQGVQLVAMNWKLDIEVANEKGKANSPVVYVELTTSERSRCLISQLEMKGSQFDVFFKNLKKIKEQLAEMIKQ